MRRAESSSGEEVMKDAKRAEFCFAQAVDVYRSNSEKKSVAKLMKRVNASKRLQNKKRRMISFGALPPKAASLSSDSESSSSSFFSDSDHDKTVMSDITWMENYGDSQYYRKQHLLFLQEQEQKPGIYSLLQGNFCSLFCHTPPVNNIEFVESELLHL